MVISLLDPKGESLTMKSSRLCAMVLVCAVGMGVMSLWADDLPVMAFWQFNADDPYADSSGNNRPLTTKSRPAQFLGNFARFDRHQAGYLGRSMDFKACTQLTVEMFVRLTSHQIAPYYFFNYYGWNNPGTGFFGMWGGDANNPPGKLGATWLKNGNGREIVRSDDDVLSDHQWHHVAVVIDATSDDEGVLTEMKMYVDGVLQTTGSSAVHHSVIFPYNVEFILGYLGGGNAAGFSSVSADRGLPFEGDMDDVRITAAALTPDQFLKAPTVSETEHPKDAVVWGSDKVPAAGDDVYVPGGAAVVLSGETPVFNSVTVDGSIHFSNSNNCLRAGTVRLGPGGRLLAGEPFGGSTDVSNAVRVVCDTLTVDRGALVSGTGSGFWGGTAAHDAAGPGATSHYQDNRIGAGSHGSFSTTSPLCDKPAYGDAEWPVTAGSGGWRATSDIAASHGGGVIRLDVTGTATVNGAICADSPDVINYASYGRSSAGAGGSILLICSRLIGSGRFSAQGGRASGMTSYSSPGAGGRIAIHYDPSVQTAEDAKDIVFEVQAGQVDYSKSYSFAETGFWMYAGEGTLWFTDERLITAANLSNFRGRLVNAADITLDGDAVVSNWVGFATDGVKVHVKGDLTVTGKDGRLEIGSVRQFSGDSNVQRRSYVSDTASRLTVDGELVVTNAARFDIYAAASSVAQPVGALVEAQGFVIATNSLVYPFTDPTNGGAPAFSVATLDVLPGGTFGVVGGGYTGRKGSSGYGPGYGTTSFGAGFGGFGGRVRTWNGEIATTNTTTDGQTYGDALRPTLAGSGGGHGWNGQNGGGIGGCVLHVRATDSMRIAGTVTANGTTPEGHYAGASGGAGGSILLEAPVVTVDPAAKVTACGGATATTTVKSNYACGGGGGRIAIWTGKWLWEPGWRKSRYTVSEDIPAELSEAFDVSGGESRVAERGYAGEPGTIRFVTTLPQPGVLIIVR